MNLIGHKNTKEQIFIAMNSARKRNMSMPHMLFSGLAGCGKTSMAQELARISEYDFLAAIATDIKTHKDVSLLIEKMNYAGYNKNGDRVNSITPTILFIDEIHQLPSLGQEVLGLVMERFMLETGEPNKFFWAPYFTVVGATTDDGKLNKPFRERFKLRFIFEQYSVEEIAEIIGISSKRLKLFITTKGIFSIAKRSRGIPRIAISYVERVRDYALATNKKVITNIVTEELFTKLGIDADGLTITERKLLKILYDNEIAVGVDNLAMLLNESPKNLTGTIEPFLMQKGFIVRSNKGRLITKVGIDYLKQTGYLGKKEKLEITANYVRK